MNVTSPQINDDIKADGKTFDFLPESAIKKDELKTFPFNSPKQYIKTETSEFSAVCPFSGLPDIARLVIEYYPTAQLCVELKSLKYYLVSYRNVGVYQENATRLIYLHLRDILQTERLRVTTVYNTRGGFDTTSVEGKL